MKTWITYKYQCSQVSTISVFEITLESVYLIKWAFWRWLIMIWQKIGNSVSDGLFRDSVHDSVIAENQCLYIRQLIFFKILSSCLGYCLLLFVIVIISEKLISQYFYTYKNIPTLGQIEIQKHHQWYPKEENTSSI